MKFYILLAFATWSFYFLFIFAVMFAAWLAACFLSWQILWDLSMALSAVRTIVIAALFMFLATTITGYSGIKGMKAKYENRKNVE